MVSAIYWLFVIPRSGNPVLNGRCAAISSWIPACAGMTGKKLRFRCGSRHLTFVTQPWHTHGISPSVFALASGAPAQLDAYANVEFPIPWITQPHNKFVESCGTTASFLSSSTTFAIPCKSPQFDAEWRANGHIDRAIRLIERWCRAQPIAGLHVEVLRPNDRTPLIYMEVSRHGRCER